MATKNVTSDEKMIREAQTKAYETANWAFVIKLTGTGGGAGRMVKRGK